MEVRHLRACETLGGRLHPRALGQSGMPRMMGRGPRVVSPQSLPDPPLQKRRNDAEVALSLNVAECSRSGVMNPGTRRGNV